MNNAKTRRLIVYILAAVTLAMCAAPASAEEWIEPEQTIDPDAYPEYTESFEQEALTQTIQPAGQETPAEPGEAYAEPPLVLVPESTGYAVGAFSEDSRQSGGTTRADVLPFMLNDPAPDFLLQTTLGDFQGPGSYGGNNIIITFWISWKDGCLSSLSALRSAQRRYPDFSILAVNSLPAENNNAAWTEEAFMGHIGWINSYFEENGFGFSALLDVNGQVTSAYRAEQIPMTYFIDRDGIIRITWPGVLTGDTLDTLLGMMSALDRF
ncbi:MAG: TlpA family protein disulfide reductase [Oscillospiraceae bacterium]|jgi:peroxiredoxin|nr:TlpA family protein disulfide reductase [Oscillospiraceae bacterium]